MSKIKRLEHRSGRGANALPRDQRVYVYFTLTEYTTLQKRVEQAGAELSTYMRTMALKGSILTRLTEEERAFFRQLVGMSNQLYQLTQLARSDGIKTIIPGLESLLTQLDEQLKKMNHAK